MFDQWTYQMRKDDLESQSNPSEDELTPIERKEKVLESKASKKKTKFKGNKINIKNKGKKTNDDSIININKLQTSSDEKDNLMFSETKRSITGPVIMSRKPESQRVMHSEIKT